MEKIIKNVIPSKMGEMQIDIEEFITLYNEKKCEILDIRIPMEMRVWQLNFGLKIPAPELPERLEELPKDKLIIVACPRANRSNIVHNYLVTKGFKARYLNDGLLGLMNYLKGDKAKEILLD